MEMLGVQINFQTFDSEIVFTIISPFQLTTLFNNEEQKKNMLTIKVDHPVLLFWRRLISSGGQKTTNDTTPSIPLPADIHDHDIIDNNNNASEGDSTKEQSLAVISLDGANHLARDDEQFQTLLAEARNGLELFPPALSSEGVNGTYFLHDSQKRIVAIFKPQDEEGNSPFNPKKSSSNDNNNNTNDHDDNNNNKPRSALRKGILPGEAAAREVAAYLLDKEGFFGVPVTHMVTLNHPSLIPHKDDDVTCDNHHQHPTTITAAPTTLKTGSMQQFVENDGAAWDIGPQVFPVDEVHKIGILDLLIFNTDRHEGNILFQKIAKRSDDEESKKSYYDDSDDDDYDDDDGYYSNKKSNQYDYRLIPIDHGFSMPDNLSHAWFDWLLWPQAKQPFSERSLDYINRIDVSANVAMLKGDLDIRDECLRVMKISTLLLKRGASLGLSLYNIGNLASRRDLREPSQLERMVEKALSSVGKSSLCELELAEEECFMAELEKVFDDELPQWKVSRSPRS